MAEQGVRVELPDSIYGGVYANFFGVTINPDIVIMDFASTLPEPGETKPERNVVVSRVLTSRDGAKRLAELLDRLIKETEPK